jgi:hypothetical protein
VTEAATKEVLVDPAWCENVTRINGGNTNAGTVCAESRRLLFNLFLVLYLTTLSVAKLMQR